MVEVDSATPLIGERGAMTILDAFENTPVTMFPREARSRDIAGDERPS